MALNTIPNKGLTSRGYPSDRIVTPLIINGDMSVAQRDTSSSSTGYVVDRFNFRVSNTDQFAYTHSQSTTVPTGQGFSNSWKLDVTTAETTLDSDEEVAFQTRLEAQNLQSLKFGTSSAETLSLSFWVRSNKTGTYGIYLRQHDAGKNYVASYTINSADTWEKKIVTISGNTADTIANDNGIGFWINWTLAAGSSLDGATMNSWHTAATEIAPTGQVNITDNTSNEWYITGVQLEVGEFDSTTIPSFPFESFVNNLGKCQRYYNQVDGGLAGAGAAGNQVTFAYNFPTEMRADPSITVSAPLKIDKVGDAASTQSSSNIGQIGNSTSNKSAGMFAGNFSVSSGQGVTFYTAAGGGGIIKFDSEL